MEGRGDWGLGDSGTRGWWRRWDIEVVSCILLVWMFDGDTTTSKNAGTDAVGNGISPLDRRTSKGVGR